MPNFIGFKWFYIVFDNQCTCVCIKMPLTEIDWEWEDTIQICKHQNEDTLQHWADFDTVGNPDTHTYVRK